MPPPPAVPAAEDGGEEPAPQRRPGSPPHPSGDPLLAAKFAVPAVPPTFVARQRLLDRLTEGAQGPLTVITGPAGAGKTTLAASWHEARMAPGPVVWLTVEGDDNAPGMFWAYVLGAFRFHQVPLPDGVGSPSTRGDVDHSLLVRLASELAGLSRPVVLVLDGLERLAARDVAAGLEFVLAHAGPLLRLVVTSRVDPPLPLHRYRAEGRMCEIRGSELAFTPGEAHQLMHHHGLTASEQGVDTLTSRTEGWAAGLRLCALAMQRVDDAEQFTRSFAASRSAVADYLMAEVLDAQPAATQDLLIRTSILGHIHPHLANALTGREDAEWILAGLARANAFVEPIGGTPWYRCHPLFAEVLRAHLRSRRPGLVHRLHQRAARWSADHDRLTEAFEHAAAADDWAYATTLLVDRMVTGRLLTGPDSHRLQRLFSEMPSDLPGSPPALAAAACALARGDTAAGRGHLERAHRDQRAAAAREVTPENRLTYTLLRFLTTGRTDDGEGVAADGCAPYEAFDRLTRTLMGHVPPAKLERHPEIEALRCYARARALLGTGHRAEARGAFLAALSVATSASAQTVRYHCLGALALSEAVDGMLREAETHATQGLAAAEEYGVPLPNRSGMCRVALATVASGRGDLARVRRHLREATASWSPDDPLAAAETAVLRSRAELANGRTGAALSVLDDIPASRDDPLTGEEAARRLAVARSTAHLARGDPVAALSALHGASPGGAAYAVALASAQLAGGDAEGARRLLTGLHRDPGAGPADRVRALLVLTRAAAQDDDLAGASAFLGQALATAQPQLLRGPFLETGPWLRQMLARVPEVAAVHPWLTGRPGSVNGHSTVPARDGRPVLVEHLSRRERDVLRCAAQTMSTEEIAEELYVSVNTVKTHLKSIYRKLSVSRRSEAVRWARETDLL
ncbi:LuxR C-terminal-related transcriptional regulator [Streptomyces sp. NPDC051219]|uniref:LuxR C-terminal-related transcriptional regulator n=1 Tax=Streptomyces sp. NPDC051219 TaxID=3155283 RepID=UPI00342B176C